jgi:hypothetical protein
MIKLAPANKNLVIAMLAMLILSPAIGSAELIHYEPGDALTGNDYWLEDVDLGWTTSSTNACNEAFAFASLLNLDSTNL